MEDKYFGLPVSKILTICGFIGIFGIISVVLTDIVGSIVLDDYNPVKQTISNLAIGEAAWIQDVGLNFFAASFAACGIGFLILNMGGWKWKTGSSLLFVLAADILIISEFDKYADLNSFGSTVHLACVIILAITFTLALVLTASGLSNVEQSWRPFNLVVAFIWAVLAPIFFIISTDWDGAYERFLSLIVIVWIARASMMLCKQGSGTNSS